MSIFPLPIFPEASLASSVVTSVWIGVLVFGFFHLRLGWVFSGLVVPGYLVPIMILKPISALVILLEAVVTYALVQGLRSLLVRTKVACELFGRDRFFAIILISIVVRVVGDAALWPWLGDLLFQRFGVHFDYRHQLSSFGLIVICLIANQFWKTGVLRGLPPMIVVMGSTFLVIRFGLMEFTNFSMSNLAYLYEDMATSIEASPKAYIVLVTTAFAASRMNMLYGWDFSGIMIPALIALQWFEPLKILTSFVEALVILGLGIMALKLPMFRSLTMEGARKMMLFFTISYLYKVIVSYIVTAIAPEFKVSDAYGFGYLLPTLMAIKMHEKGHVIRQMRMTLEVSLVSATVASVIGFLLTHLPQPEEGFMARSAVASERPKNRSLNDALQDEEIRSMRMLLRDTRLMPNVQEREAFRQGVQAVMRYAESADALDYRKALLRLQSLGYQLEVLEGRYLLLSEGRRYRGWGLFVIDRESENQLCIQSPQPFEEEGAWEAAHAVFHAAGAHALALGTRPQRGLDDKKSPLMNRLTLFHTFHRLLNEAGVVQVRGYTKDSHERLRDAWNPLGEGGPVLSSCWIKDRPPQAFDFEVLGRGAEELLFPPVVNPLGNVQRRSHRSLFVELFLTEEHLDELAIRYQQGTMDAPRMLSAARGPQSLLLEQLRLDPPLLAPKDSEAYEKPSTSDLLYIEKRLVTPLVQLARSWFERRPAIRMQRLERLNQRAMGMDYRVALLESDEAVHVALFPDEASFPSRSRHWGFLVLRLGEAEEIVIEVPRPDSRLQVVNAALTWLEPLRARALLIAGAHPDANGDRSADVLLSQNKRSFFTLVHEVLLRESAETPSLALQWRGLAEIPKDSVSKESEIPLAYLATHGDDLDEALIETLQARLETAAITVSRVEGEASTAGYDVGSQIHTRYLAASANNSIGILWLGPDLRSRYSPKDPHQLSLDALASLGIPTEEVALRSWLQERPRVEADAEALEALSDRMVESINRFLSSGDVNTIDRLVKAFPHHQFARLYDFECGQTFLAATRDERWEVVAGLYPGLKKVGERPDVPLSSSVVTSLITHEMATVVAGPGEEDD